MKERMNDYDQYEPLVSKRNRRKKHEPKTHSTEVGPLPPTGIHKEDPDAAQRKLREMIRKAKNR
jgi:hypothetical protein